MRKRMIGVWVLLAALALAGCMAGEDAVPGDTGAQQEDGGEAPADGVSEPGDVPAGSSVTGEPPADDSEVAVPADEVAIYAAVIRQLYTVDHTFGSNPPNWPYLYVLDSTDDTIAGTGEEPGESRPLNAAARESIEAQLGDLPAEIRWVSAWEDVPIDETDGSVDGGEGVIITLGNIHEQADGSAHVPAGLHCGGLCATGMTYVLEASGGDWVITGTTGPAWIS